MLLVLLAMGAVLAATALVTSMLNPMILPVVVREAATISEAETPGTTHLQVAATGIPTAQAVVRPEVVTLNGVLLLQERNQNGKASTTRCCFRCQV